MLVYQEILLGVVFLVIVGLVLTQPRLPIPKFLHRFKLIRLLFEIKGKQPEIGVGVDLGNAPILGVLLLLAAQILDGQDVHFGFVGDARISPYSIVTLFMTLAYTCISLNYTGLLAYIALRIAKAAGHSGRRLFVYTFLSSCFTLLTSNDIVVLTLTPLTLGFTSALDVDPRPFLFAQFFAANVISASLFIGNSTNIIVSLAFKMSFAEYSKWLTLPAVASTITLFGMLFLTFRSIIPPTIKKDLNQINPREKLRDVQGAIFGSIVLSVSLVLLAVSFWLKIEVWTITLSAGSMMLIRDVVADVGAYISNRNKGITGRSAVRQSVLRRKSADRSALLEPLSAKEIEIESGGAVAVEVSGNADEDSEPFVLSVGPIPLPTPTATLSHMPWKIIPFVFSMFIITNGFFRSNWFAHAASLLSHTISDSIWVAVFLFTAISSVLCNLLNNQPMTIMMTRLLQHPDFVAPYCPTLAARLGLIYGSNVGANLTFVGALAGIMWSKIIAEKKVESITFWTFVKYGLLVMFPVIAVGCLVICLEVSLMCDNDHLDPVFTQK